MGNPFLPRRGEGANATTGSRDAAPSSLGGLSKRTQAQRVQSAPLWSLRMREQQSPVDMLARMPRLATPLVQPATWRPAPAALPVRLQATGTGLGTQNPQ